MCVTQITDDSELALALASGLSQGDPSEGFPAEHVAQSYGAWLNSHPFDVGECTGSGCGKSMLKEHGAAAEWL